MSLEKKLNLFSINKINNFTLTATEKELVEIGELLVDFNVIAVNEIVLNVTISRENNTVDLKISGAVKLSQECGNTLEAISSNINFVIQHNYKLSNATGTAKKYIIEEDDQLNNEQIVEELSSEIIDIKEIALEELVLLVDPYITSDNSDFTEHIEEKVITNPFEKFIAEQKNQAE